MKKNLLLQLLFCFSAITFSLFFTACEENEPSVTPPASNNVRFFVGNEGNMGRNPGTLSVILKNDSVCNDIFEKTNNRPLGDTFQSMTEIDGNIWVMLQGSKKIEVLSATSYKSMQTITSKEAFTPNYALAVNDTLVAVTDKTNRQLNWIHRKKMTYLGKLEMNSTQKQLVRIGDHIFIAAGSKIAVVSAKTLTLVKEINCSAVGDSHLIVDKNNKLWVLSAKSILCINPTTFSIEKEMPITSEYAITTWGGRLTINNTKDVLYFNGAKPGANWTSEVGIYVLPITADQVGAPTIFPKAEGNKALQNLYNMEVSPENTLFICDALDYTQRGHVYEYKLDGTFLKKYIVGIIPQYIYFPR